MSGEISKFIEKHFCHFNARSLRAAAADYSTHIDSGGKMFFSMAGAMSTAELGKSLAEMIRKDKIHGICCTGANLEEDLFNLVAHDEYVEVPNYRYLSAEDENDLLKRKLNRVTDTCIPEEEAMRLIESGLIPIWKAADDAGQRQLPHEFLYDLIRSGILSQHCQVPKEDSWLLAACEKNLPIYVPGWEDSTLGNMFAALCIEGEIKNVTTVKSGVEYMMELVKWYGETAPDSPLGFFQIGGGIAGDFPICVVPLMIQDLKLEDTPLWAYFCQISDSTTSYGSYSGAEPNEKITWGKLAVDTPSHVIESDATIVAPLIFASVLGW